MKNLVSLVSGLYLLLAILVGTETFPQESHSDALPPEVLVAQLFEEVKKLTASDSAAGDWFGYSAAISGDTAVIGAYDVSFYIGSAYVFERNQGGADNWGEVKKLTASDAAADDRFGASVAISGDTVVVGAPWNDEAGISAGSAYIFERNQGGANHWGEVKKLTASDAAGFELFGWSVAISADTVVIAAYLDNDAGEVSGSAYIFERNRGGAENWAEVKKLIASDAAAGDEFGQSVAISADTVVVAAGADDDAGGSSGSAYIFERNQGGAEYWTPTSEISRKMVKSSKMINTSPFVVKIHHINSTQHV